VSGDLESATTVASFMEGFWGMGSTVSSYSTAKRLEVGAPGGGQGGKRVKGHDAEVDMRRALADRIEDMLGEHLEKVGRLLTEHRRDVLVLAHALETHKTMTGDDVVAVLEGRAGPLVDGTVYRRPEFLREIEAYHKAATTAHARHAAVSLSLPPLPEPELPPESEWQPAQPFAAPAPAPAPAAEQLPESSIGS
jgi:hypothetical protein